MQLASALGLAALALTSWPAAAALALSKVSAITGQKAPATNEKVTEVVNMLEDMLKSSKEEAEKQRTLYAKFKCYCVDNEQSSSEELETLTEDIDATESQIEEARGSTAKLSEEVSQLTRDIDTTSQALEQAESLRQKAKEEYGEEKEEMKLALQQLRDAIQVLAEQGADQTLNSAADHEKYMAGYDGKSSMLLQDSVKQALLAASSMVSKEKAQTLTGFLQAPAYSAQSGEVVGILKDMRDKFQTNSDEAKAAEDKESAAFKEYRANAKKALAEMRASKTKKEGLLGDNDSKLAGATKMLSQMQTDKGDTEAFLENLRQSCAEKRKQYSERVELRRGEDTAIAQAIAVLNSDTAFATFGGVSFLQIESGGHSAGAIAATQRADNTAQRVRRRQLQSSLQKAYAANHSPVFLTALVMMQAGNPFKKVLAEMEKITQNLAAEQKADDKRKAWCDSERSKAAADISKAAEEVSRLNGELTGWKADIENPETGFESLIEVAEKEISDQQKAKADLKAQRKSENADYQKNVANCAQVEELLGASHKVLEEYYDRLEESFVQVSRITTAEEPPETFDGKYKGQSEAGGRILGLLSNMLATTTEQHKQAKEDEAQAQKDFEKLAASIDATLQDQMNTQVELKEKLAEAEKEIQTRHRMLKAVTKEEDKLNKYVASFKEGCDFIDTHLDKRTSSREAEAEAINTAVEIVQGTPAYKEAAVMSHRKKQGACKDTCVEEGDDHATCLACQAKVTVVGYCAGHPDTKGC